MDSSDKVATKSGGVRTVQMVAWILIGIATIVFIIGVTNQYCSCSFMPNLGDTANGIIGDFYANIAVDSMSIAFAILVIDWLNARWADKELKAQLIRGMRSRDNGLALQAVEELRARGWLTDGTLRGANLTAANLGGVDLKEANLERAILNHAILVDAELEGINLQHAQLEKADFRDANLSKAKLQHARLKRAKLNNARLVEANLEGTKFGLYYYEGDTRADADMTTLAVARRLTGATLPNGRKYDGRLNLDKDVQQVSFLGLNISDPSSISRYYQITKEDYLTGQNWAQENLRAVRHLATLNFGSAEKKTSVRPKKYQFKSSIASHKAR
jgi:uncharacterized membrane protein